MRTKHSPGQGCAHAIHSLAGGPAGLAGSQQDGSSPHGRPERSHALVQGGPGFLPALRKELPTPAQHQAVHANVLNQSLVAGCKLCPGAGGPRLSSSAPKRTPRSCTASGCSRSSFRLKTGVKPSFHRSSTVTAAQVSIARSGDAMPWCRAASAICQHSDSNRLLTCHLSCHLIGIASSSGASLAPAARLLLLGWSFELPASLQEEKSQGHNTLAPSCLTPSAPRPASPWLLHRFSRVAGCWLILADWGEGAESGPSGNEHCPHLQP